MDAMADERDDLLTQYITGVYVEQKGRSVTFRTHPPHFYVAPHPKRAPAEAKGCDYRGAPGRIRCGCDASDPIHLPPVTKAST
jgi:hypothetical protein